MKTIKALLIALVLLYGAYCIMARSDIQGGVDQGPNHHHRKTFDIIPTDRQIITDYPLKVTQNESTTLSLLVDNTTGDITASGTGYFATVSVASPGTVDAPLTVQQIKDASGIKMYGYDDKSSDYIEMNINQYGNGIINSVQDWVMQRDGTTIFKVYSDSLQLRDSMKLNLGNSDDVAFYHDGSNGYLYNNTGNLYLYNNTAATAFVVAQEDTSSATNTLRIENRGNGDSITVSDAGTNVFAVSNDGNIYASGTVYANAFEGDGSALTGISSDNSLGDVLEWGNVYATGTPNDFFTLQNASDGNSPAFEIDFQGNVSSSGTLFADSMDLSANSNLATASIGIAGEEAPVAFRVLGGVGEHTMILRNDSGHNSKRALKVVRTEDYYAVDISSDGGGIRFSRDGTGPSDYDDHATYLQMDTNDASPGHYVSGGLHQRAPSFMSYRDGFSSAMGPALYIRQGQLGGSIDKWDMGKTAGSRIITYLDDNAGNNAIAAGNRWTHFAHFDSNPEERGGAMLEAEVGCGNLGAHPGATCITSFINAEATGTEEVMATFTANSTGSVFVAAQENTANATTTMRIENRGNGDSITVSDTGTNVFAVSNGGNVYASGTIMSDTSVGASVSATGTCDADHRGQMQLLEIGDSGESDDDALYICGSSGDATYSWATVTIEF